MRRERHRQPAHRAVGHGCIDPASFSPTLHSDERAQDRDRRLKSAAADVGDLDRQRNRRTLTLAVESERACGRHVVEVVAGPRRKRPVLPVTGDRAHDEPLVSSVQGVPTETKPVHDAGPVALDQDVRSIDQAQQKVAARVRLEVQRHAALVAVDGVEQRALAAHQRRRPTHVIAGARLFDLDHIGAHVSEQQGAVGPRQEPGQVQHADPRQRHDELNCASLVR